MSQPTKILIIGDGMKDVFHNVLEVGAENNRRTVRTYTVQGAANRVGRHVTSILSYADPARRFDKMVLRPEIKTTKTYVLCGGEIELRLDEDLPSSFDDPIGALAPTYLNNDWRGGAPLVLVVSDYDKGAIGSVKQVLDLASLDGDVTYVINTKQPYMYVLPFRLKTNVVFVCNEHEYEEKREYYVECPYVVQTLGARGARVHVHGKEPIDVPNPRQLDDAYVVSTIGAGDAFVAALAAQLAITRPCKAGTVSLADRVQVALAYSALAVCVPPWHLPKAEWTARYLNLVKKLEENASNA